MGVAFNPESNGFTEVYHIPTRYQKGTYGINDFNGNFQNVITLNHKEYGDIVTYEVPDYENGRTITLYGISKNELEENLKAFYGDSGQLKKLTVNINNKDMLLYIHYESKEASMQEIQNFAIQNANAIIDKICMYKESVSRLFIEYFNDGEYIDYHAKIGTEVQKNALKKKYRRDKYILDSCGDYPGEMIAGDNNTLKIMVLCADNEEMNFFRFAVNIMTEYIKEKAQERLNKADDFKFICVEYD